MFTSISEKLAGAKIEHKEVAQSIASQKAKLTEVLNQINYHLQVLSKYFCASFTAKPQLKFHVFCSLFVWVLLGLQSNCVIVKQRVIEGSTAVRKLEPIIQNVSMIVR